MMRVGVAYQNKLYYFTFEKASKYLGEVPIKPTAEKLEIWHVKCQY